MCVPAQACEPFKDHPLLRRSVRVVSYEQIAQADRRGSGGGGGGGGGDDDEQGPRAAGARLPNLVMPYPSSIVGPTSDGAGRRRKPQGQDAPISAPPPAALGAAGQQRGRRLGHQILGQQRGRRLGQHPLGQHPLLRPAWAWTLPAPPGAWDWAPRKSMLVFAAFGSLTNASRYRYDRNRYRYISFSQKYRPTDLSVYL